MLISIEIGEKDSDFDLISLLESIIGSLIHEFRKRSIETFAHLVDENNADVESTFNELVKQWSSFNGQQKKDFMLHLSSGLAKQKDWKKQRTIQFAFNSPEEGLSRYAAIVDMQAVALHIMVPRKWTEKQV